MYSILHVGKRSPYRDRIFKALRGQFESLEVEFFESAARALKRLESAQFECITCVHSSPGIDCVHFVRRLRKSGDITPVILISDDEKTDHSVDLVDLGVDDYLSTNDENTLAVRLASCIRRAVVLNARRKELREAEESLENRDNQIENVFTKAPDGIVITDAKGIITDCNKCESEILGYPRSEIIGKHISDFHTKLGAEILINKLKTLKKNGTVSADLDLKRKDGRIIRVWRMGSAVYNSKRALKGAVFTTRETTDRKRSEDSLRKSGELLASILECSLDGTIVFNARRDERGKIVDFVFVLVNPEAERKLFRSQKKLLGVGLLEVAPENRDNGLFDMFIEVVESGEPIEKEHHFQYGEIEGWFQIRAAKLADGCAVTFSDISKLKETENALMNERNMFIGGPVVVFRTSSNPKAPPTYLSPNMAQFGYAVEDLMSGKIGIRDLIHPEDYRRVIKTILQNAKNNRDTFDVEFRVVKADGEVRWVSEYIVILRDENDEFSTYQGYVLDITERVKAEQSLQRMLDELEKRVEERTIKLIRANEFLLKEISERKQVEYKLRSYQDKLRSLASELTLAGEKERRRLAIALHDRIGQSLALSKIKLTTLIQEIDSKDFMDKLRDITSVINQTIQDTRSLTFEISPPDLYELGFVAAAESLIDRYGEEYGIKAEFVSNESNLPISEEAAIILYQVLRELIINIIKHSNADRMRVTLRKAGTYVKVRIWDNGKGFDPSSVLHDSSSLSFGLFSIQERLEPLGGNMDISSKIGVGTEIILKVPLKSAGNSADE